LTYVQQIDFEAQYQSAWYIHPDGRLDVPKLLTAFQTFFREHAEHWLERFAYKEAGPQLLLQAFLQRIVNGGGRIEREYGLGRMRTDLLILWPYGGGEQVQRVVLELKVLHKGLEQTIALGLEQTYAYLDRCAAGEAHLLIFDRSGRDWAEKVFRRSEQFNGRAIEVWGLQAGLGPPHHRPSQEQRHDATPRDPDSFRSSTWPATSSSAPAPRRTPTS
jgi:hypothetical protein